MKKIEITVGSVPEEVADYCRKRSETDEQLELEVQAYLDFADRYHSELDTEKRRVMANMLHFLVYSDEHEMNPSYVLTEALDNSLRQERDAAEKLHPREIHEQVAHILTSSTNTVGRGQTTNWKIHTRADYNVPEGLQRSRYQDWSAGEILNSYVSFGSHNFGIGSATQRVLDMLENRYGIDFNQLENQLKREGTP